MRYKRVLVKVSGGALAGKSGDAFDQFRLEHVADEILTLVNQGIEVAIVVGGGNIFRGRLAEMWGIDPVEADNIGVLGTVINSLMLRGVLKSKTNKEVRVMTSIPITSVAEPYIRLRATHHLDKGYIVIFAGGNGQPFVTTDYPAVQRALETHCDAIFAAKQGVNGVYTNDPKIDSKAKKYKTLNYNDVIKENIKVMDQSALILARDHHLPVHVFDFEQTNTMTLICQGENKGTIVSNLATSFE
ncbi:UMP kinase [Sporolactobacillus laevolacticus]|uniref:Uridylate kinase n=1 Tax=Sporolactobacillus laevolacticus DSM 442 TaxID=1395513 RepID=V6IUL9_9BACL|nr:UMP kinase [Sporolactobacillus laevolacticus]EST10722.1 uridylate kinase [Sporolactobacillus laevolacticus DSM 442]